MARQPENMHLRRQMLRVYQADIKTVDAFCAGPAAGERPPAAAGGAQPDPGFPGAGRTGGHAAARRVLDRVLEDFYAHIEGTKTPACWRRPWVPAGTTGPWRPWCWTCTRRPRATPPPAVAGAAAGGLGQHPRSPWRTPGGRLMEDALRRTWFWAADRGRGVDGGLSRIVYKAYGDRFLEVAQDLEALRRRRRRVGTPWPRASPSFRRMGVAKRGRRTPPAGSGRKAVLEQCKTRWMTSGALLAVPEAELLEDLRPWPRPCWRWCS